jgi:Protein of unknown function (DUF3224)
MTTHATGTVLGTDWKESAFHRLDGAGKLSHASVSDDYEGDITGTGTLQYLLAYSADPKGACRFTGVERVEGSIGGKHGSFVLEHSGTYDADGLKARITVLEGCGTGDLASLRGSGTVTAGAGVHRADYTLDYDFG